jgi:hypothetical protein
MGLCSASELKVAKTYHNAGHIAGKSFLKVKNIANLWGRFHPV